MPLSQVEILKKAEPLASNLAAGDVSVKKSAFLAVVADFLSDPNADLKALSRTLELLKQGSGGHLNRGLGHLMASHRRQRTVDLAGVRESLAEHQRCEEIRDDVPRRPRGLGTVERIGIGHAFPDADRPTLFDRHELELPLVNAPEARLEITHERQAHQAQFEPFDPHRPMLSQALPFASRPP